MAGLALSGLLLAPHSEIAPVTDDVAALTSTPARSAPGQPAAAPAVTRDAVTVDAGDHDHATRPHPTAAASGPADLAADPTSSAVCGPGHTALRVIGGVDCIHKNYDVISRAAVSPSVNKMQPKCYGNGVNGNRIQLLYMFREGHADRRAEIVPRILGEWMPYMESAFRRASAAQGREVGLRFHAPGCKITVDTLEIGAEDADSANFEKVWVAIHNTLTNAGFNETSRKYMIWYDGPSFGPQGAGSVRRDYDEPQPASLHDNGTPANPNNVGYLPVMYGGSIAVAFRTAAPAPDRANGGWGQSAMGAFVEVHELVHALGGVQISAPNSNGLGHCSDGTDIMCYPEGGKKVYTKCLTKIPMLDCGADDYFHANPGTGSYLATHWNIARSSFLGDALGLDAVPLELPRA
ncbi:MAG TPA: hypothetical protein VM030_07555 [Acidimicrobiales bacterium]|nr:hypothetical protein [Acidimicrobiales bacterium]